MKNTTIVVLATLVVATSITSIAAAIHHYSSRPSRPRIGVSTATITTYVEKELPGARVAYSVNLSDGSQRFCSSDPGEDAHTPVMYESASGQHLCEFKVPLGVKVTSVIGVIDSATLSQFEVIAQDESSPSTYQEIRIN